MTLSDKDTPQNEKNTEPLEDLPGDIKVDIRGHSSLNRPPSFITRFFAFLFDLTIVLTLFFVGIRLLHLPPLPSAVNVFIFGSIAGLTAIIPLLIFGQTAGQSLWRLKILDHGFKRLQWPVDLPLYIKSWIPGKWDSPPIAKTFQTSKPSHMATGIAIFLTLVSITCSVFLARSTILGHPLYAKVIAWEIKPFVPQDENVWMTVPFFYTLGAWPKRFIGKPVLYTLPYEKGPPKNFTGHIIARLKMPDTRLIIEGPKTPPGQLKPDTVKNCLLKNTEGFMRCSEMRENIIGRHIREMSRFSPDSWTVKWFMVNNTLLPEGEAPQGIHISAKNKKKAQDRFVLINSNGINQAVILKRPLNSEGETALMMLEQTIGSLKLANELKPGKALINNKISATRMDAIKGITDTISFIAKIAEIQTLLLAKISVDPKNLLAYYHLGGTTYMLIKHAAELRTVRTQLVNKNVLLLLDEWTAAAKPMVHSAYRYSKDIDPDHPNTARLQNLWIETQKY